MKKLAYITVLTILFCCAAREIRAEKFEVGARFPVDKLSEKKKPSDNTIVVFMPSLTSDCDYASMLTQSFYYYFDRRMAFEGLRKSPETRIFLVVHDKMDLARSAQNIFGGMNVIYDDKGELFASFGVKAPAEKNAASTVILLDADERVAHVDENYRAQGEHLKPLENKLKELNGIYEKVRLPAAPKELKVGDPAPDFQVNKKERLSNLRGQVVLLSFYPAAFSGTLPKPVQAPIIVSDLSMSCSLQIDRIELNVKSKKEAKRIVISSSTDSLLNEWRRLLRTQTLEYTNDPDYSIASKYFSYNPNGYNNRVSVIIDRKGRIAYIDKDFVVNDEVILNAKIDELNTKIDELMKK